MTAHTGTNAVQRQTAPDRSAGSPPAQPAGQVDLRSYGAQATELLAQAEAKRDLGRGLGGGTAAHLSRPLYDAGFFQSMSRFFKRYADFTGCSSPREYWLAVFGQAVILLLCCVVGFLLTLLLLSMRTDLNIWWGRGVVWAGTLCAAGMAIPNLAVTVRRLHDAGLAGWFVLLGCVPSVGHIILCVLVCLPPSPQGRRFDSRRQG